MSMTTTMMMMMTSQDRGRQPGPAPQQEKLSAETMLRRQYPKP
jgi:hypothetical protein